MSLAYYMRENSAYHQKISPSDLQNNLNLYFQCCSCTINSEMGAIIASTLANGGTCPTTNEKIFDESITKDCLSLMYMCGMYDYSGQFAFKIGLPAKSGVSGCLLLVIPGKCGICIWSPRLDQMGNTVRGVEFCKLFTKYSKNKYHIFHTLTYNINEITKEKVINACAENNIKYIEYCIEKHIDFNQGDYDNRTPLHLACINGHYDLVIKIINLCDITISDRWGNTALSDVHKLLDENKPSMNNNLLKFEGVEYNCKEYDIIEYTNNSQTEYKVSGIWNGHVIEWLNTEEEKIHQSKSYKYRNLLKIYQLLSNKEYILASAPYLYSESHT